MSGLEKTVPSPPRSHPDRIFKSPILSHFHAAANTQGGPLSPLLANIMLDDLDKELEKRGHRFARYADDFIILVKSQSAGERVMKSIRRFLEKILKLKVNEKQGGPNSSV